MYTVYINIPGIEKMQKYMYNTKRFLEFKIIAFISDRFVQKSHFRLKGRPIKIYLAWL